MRTLILLSTLLCICPPAAAEAAPEKPNHPEAPAAHAASPGASTPTVRSDASVRSKGLWLEFKLNQGLGFGMGYFVHYVPSPGFMIGYKWNRLVLGVEMGASFYINENSDDSGFPQDEKGVQFRILPVLQLLVYNKGPVSLYVQTGAGVAYGRSKNPTSNFRTESLVVLMTGGFGVRYFLHPRFALGGEFGASATRNRTEIKIQSNDSRTKGWGANIYGALTAAVVF
jgi:hypothetical protein